MEGDPSPTRASWLPVAPGVLELLGIQKPEEINRGDMRVSTIVTDVLH